MVDEFRQTDHSRFDHGFSSFKKGLAPSTVSVPFVLYSKPCVRSFKSCGIMAWLVRIVALVRVQHG